MKASRLVGTTGNLTILLKKFISIFSMFSDFTSLWATHFSHLESWPCKQWNALWNHDTKGLSFDHSWTTIKSPVLHDDCGIMVEYTAEKDDNRTWLRIKMLISQLFTWGGTPRGCFWKHGATSVALPPQQQVFISLFGFPCHHGPLSGKLYLIMQPPNMTTMAMTWIICQVLIAVRWKDSNDWERKLQ